MEMLIMMNNPLFKCIVVLYNTHYTDSNTLKFLFDCPEYKENQVKIYVVDNSTRDYKNEDIVKLHNIHYLTMKGNVGLSKAYNAAIDLIKKEEKEESMIIILDDDTTLGTDYFSKLSEEIQDKNYSIFLPIVLDQRGVLSPSLMYESSRCRRCESLDQLNDENICGINSGMAIRSTLFDGYRYNEAIFLDFVDHNFLRDMKRKGKRIKVIDSKFYQNFSSNTDNYEQSLNRFKIFKKDIKVFYSHSAKEKMIFHYVILRRKAELLRKFRHIGILFV